MCLLLAYLSPLRAEEPDIKNIVLVHGAFTDGSIWSAVIPLLQADGYHVTAVQNPLTSLQDDVTATERVLARQQGDTLLVGHSWAGAVITQAGNAPNVKGLVYLSALVPDSGESVSQALARLHAPMDGMTADNNGLFWLDDADDFYRVMANDLPLSQARLLAATQQPIAAGAFMEKVRTLVPDSGESVSQALARLHAPMDGMTADNNGLFWLDDADDFYRVMANDLPLSQARLLAATQQPIAAGAFMEKVRTAAWHSKPSWYLITENDNALNASVQTSFARQAGAHATRIDSGHLSMISHPAEVAALIKRAAHSVNHS
nr:alpha/beta hydrolase [Raoultella terrigena]